MLTLIQCGADAGDGGGGTSWEEIVIPAPSLTLPYANCCAYREVKFKWRQRRGGYKTYIVTGDGTNTGDGIVTGHPLIVLRWR